MFSKPQNQKILALETLGSPITIVSSRNGTLAHTHTPTYTHLDGGLTCQLCPQGLALSVQQGWQQTPQQGGGIDINIAEK